MAKRRVKASASSTTSGAASGHGTTNLSQEEVTVPIPMAVNGEGIDEVLPEVNEEVTNVVTENEEVANEEQEIKNGEKLTSEEIDEKVADEEAAVEGEVEDAEEDEAGEYSEEDDEEDGDGEGEEEDEEEEEPMEVGDEEAGEEEEGEEGNVEAEAALMLVNAEEKLEAMSEGETQKVTVTSEVNTTVVEVEKADKPLAPSKKKLATVKKNKLKVLGKQKLASTEEDKPKSAGKQKVASTEEDKPKALSKKKVTVAATAEDNKPEASGKKKVAATGEDKPEASGKKKVAATGEDKPEAPGKKKAAAKGEDKPEASGKKNKSKRAESMGLIFMCNSKTKKECYQHKLLGLPASKKDIVKKVYKGMRLFLFDFDKRLLYGIYKAAGPGGYDIQPKAFGSAFPSQVRFTVLEDCLPLAEEKFKPIIKDNYFAKKKFDCQLNSEQVKKLCKLFNASKFKKPKNVAAGAEIHREADRERAVRPRVEREKLGSGRNKRKRVDEERSARRPRVERERLDRGRDRRPRVEEPIWDPRYDRPVVYERERYPSPLPPPSRAYDPYYRSVDTAMYVRDPVVDPYASYRDYNPPPRVPASTYPPLATSASEYRLQPHASSAAEYRLQPLASSASDYRLQPLASSASEYRLQPLASSASEYRLQPHASSAAEYRLPEEVPRYEYAPSRPLYRY